MAEWWEDDVVNDADFLSYQLNDSLGRASTPSLTEDIGKGVGKIAETGVGMAKTLGSGLYDLMGGNVKRSKSPWKDALKSTFIPGYESPEEKEAGYTRENYKKALKRHGLKGAQIAANAPSNAYNYLRDVMYGDMPQLDVPEAPRLEGLNQWFDEAIANQQGQETPGTQLVGGAAEFFPSSLIGGPLMSGAVFGAGLNENPIPYMALGQALHSILGPAKPSLKQQAGEIGQRVGGVGKKMASVPGNIFSKAKDAVTPEYFKQAKEYGGLAESLEREKLQAKDALQESRLGAAQSFGSELENLLGSEEGLIRSLEEYAPQQEGAARANLFKGMQEKRKAVKQRLEEEYDGFYNSPTGKKGQTVGRQKMKQPLSAEDVVGVYNKALNAIEADTTTFDLGSRLLKKQGATKAPVKDWITFRRDIDSLARKYARDANNPLSEQSAKNKASGIADNLREMASAIDSRIKGSLSPEQYTKLRNLDVRYGKEYKPFETESVVAEASFDPFGSIKTPKFFESINKLNKPEFVNNLMQDPVIQDLIAKHDLMKVDFSKAENVAAALRGDFGQALPKQIQRQMQKLSKTQDNIKLIDQANKQIAAGELTRVIREPRMKQIFKDRPDLLSKLEDVKTREEALRTIEEKLEKTGMDKKAAEQKVANFKRNFVIAGALISGAGILDVIKKWILG